MLEDNTLKAFKKFWQSKDGQAIRERLENFKADWLDNAMTSTTSEQIQYYVARSAGVATILQDFDNLCKLSKKGGHDQDSE